MEGNEMDYVKAICEAQACLTLQEVGEWLNRKSIWAPADFVVKETKTIDMWCLFPEDIEAFKRGEMPK